MSIERKTEREIELEVKLHSAVEHLEWLLDYARRVVQHQVLRTDIERLKAIRLFNALTKTEI